MMAALQGRGAITFDNAGVPYMKSLDPKLPTIGKVLRKLGYSPVPADLLDEERTSQKDVILPQRLLAGRGLSHDEASVAQHGLEDALVVDVVIDQKHGLW